MEVIEKKIGAHQRYYQKHKESGLCMYCANPAVSGNNRCIAHIIKQKIMSDRYYRNNREDCLQRIKNRRDKLIVEGKCRDCGIPLIEGEGLRCVNCNRDTRGYLCS